MSTETDVKAIEKIEQDLASAHLHSDVATLDRLTADGFMYGHAGGGPGGPETGSLEPKAKWLARLGQSKIERFDTTDLKVQVFGDTAMAYGNTHMVIAGKGGAPGSESHLRFTRVYMREGGQWKLVGHNAGRVKGYTS